MIKTLHNEFEKLTIWGQLDVWEVTAEKVNKDFGDSAAPI